MNFTVGICCLYNKINDILTTILVLCGKLFGPADSDGSAVLSIVSMHAVTVSTPTITSQG